LGVLDESAGESDEPDYGDHSDSSDSYEPSGSDQEAGDGDTSGDSGYSGASPATARGRAPGRTTRSSRGSAQQAVASSSAAGSSAALPTALLAYPAAEVTTSDWADPAGRSFEPPPRLSREVRARALAEIEKFLDSLTLDAADYAGRGCQWTINQIDIS
jgi:hypothetical protein